MPSVQEQCSARLHLTAVVATVLTYVTGTAAVLSIVDMEREKLKAEGQNIFELHTTAGWRRCTIRKD